MDSILTSIKKLLGIAEDYEYFDSDIIMHINSVFAILTQMGVGPPEGFSIEDEYAEWNDFIQDKQSLVSVKSYIHLKVKLMFDPPTSSALMESAQRMINELEWRLNLAAETNQSV